MQLSAVKKMLIDDYWLMIEKSRMRLFNQQSKINNQQWVTALTSSALS
jgi:hypothetical protein